MTNDTSTLNGSLLEMKDQLIYELAQKGVTANYDSSTGLLGLIDKIEDIEQSGSEQEIVSFDNLTTEFNYTQKRGNYGFSVTIPSGVTTLGSSCFRSCTKLVDYQLYWETPPVTWSSSLMPNNADTYFTIPNGTTANYTAKGFPSDKLIERSA